jgi:beta-aspartyl-peptidase (threonine type)
MSRSKFPNSTFLPSILFFLFILIVSGRVFSQENPSGHPFRLVVHGGAGTISKSSMGPEIERQYRDELTRAITTGYEILKNSGTSMDAVEAVIKILEDSPLFNAGKGAVFTHEGTNELDAAIMDGKTLKAGAVAAVKHIKNPISLARIVMEQSPHVMLVGDGAEAFAKEHGMELVPQKYFYTERRWKQLQEAKTEEQRGKDSLQRPGNVSPDSTQKKHGTVGCVALDKMGNLAAGTSTGGLTNKRFGRVGDTPIIGAGTYANNRTCAVSATGTGEFFVRSVAAYDISSMMEYAGMSLKQASETLIVKVGKLGGDGGVIAIDKDGNIAMPFNTSRMYRAYIDDEGKAIVKMYGE